MKLKYFLFLIILLPAISGKCALEEKDADEINSSIKDSLIEGRTYDVTLESGLEIEGVLTFEDSVSIVIESQGDIYKLARDQIKSIMIVIPESSEETGETDRKDVVQKTNECEIYLKNRTLFKNVLITGLNDSILSIEKGGVRKKINVFEVNKIKFKSEWTFWDGALMGSGIPLALFILFTSFGDRDNDSYGYVVVFSLGAIIPAGVIGGVLGILLQKDDLYDFSSANPKAKLKRIKYIIHKHTEK